MNGLLTKVMYVVKIRAVERNKQLTEFKINYLILNLLNV